MQTLNCQGTLIDLQIPKVMGIINITPDSFYDGGKSFSRDSILRQAEKMLEDGAAFLDIGGYSTRPHAEEVSEEEETRRVVEGIVLILKYFPGTLISIDTFRSKVAAKAVNSGAAIINDVSGGYMDEAMYGVVAQLQVPYILMHMRGTPKTMSQLTDYKNVTVDVITDLAKKIAAARAYGINDIVVDPGFGFAKNAQQSLELLKHLELFQNLEVPVLAGASRKSFIARTLGITPSEALNGTSCVNTIALLKGAKILRVHDVKEAVQCVKLVQNVV